MFRMISAQYWVFICQLFFSYSCLHNMYINEKKIAKEKKISNIVLPFVLDWSHQDRFQMWLDINLYIKRFKYWLGWYVERILKIIWFTVFSSAFHESLETVDNMATLCMYTCTHVHAYTVAHICISVSCQSLRLSLCPHRVSLRKAEHWAPFQEWRPRFAVPDF